MDDTTLAERTHTSLHEPLPGESRAAQQAPLSTRGGRRSQSYLVRVWVEPREVPGEASCLRAYVRDLRTGEETYLEDPAELGPHLGRQVAGAERATPVLRNGTSGGATLG